MCISGNGKLWLELDHTGSVCTVHVLSTTLTIQQTSLSFLHRFTLSTDHKCFSANLQNLNIPTNRELSGCWWFDSEIDQFCHSRSSDGFYLGAIPVTICSFLRGHLNLTPEIRVKLLTWQVTSSEAQHHHQQRENVMSQMWKLYSSQADNVLTR